MEMTGEQLVAAPRHAVWEALNDPAVLRRCIPGCQSLDRAGDDGFVAVAEIRIGPIGARFKGQVTLSELDPPNSYRISGTGNGGIAGNAKGGARVRLSDAADGGTLVAYTVEAEVGGRMAQLGGPIIDATAKNLAGKFFKTFGEVVAGEPAATTAAIAVPIAAAPAPAAPIARAVDSPAPLWGWVAAILATLLLGYVTAQAGFRAPFLLLLSIALIVTAAASYAAGRHRGAGA